MASKSIADQVKIRYVEKMGKSLGGLFYALWKDVAWLHAKWSEYRKLYGTSPERVDILNKSAPYFFYVLQGILWEDTLLHISRLMDPIESCGKSNLCLKQLEQIVPNEQPLRQEISHLIATTKDKTEFARKWRNRRLAHHDLGLAQEKEAEPLPPVSRQQVESALKAMRDVMNHLEYHYLGGTNLYEGFISSGGDANALIYCLKQTLASEEK